MVRCLEILDEMLEEREKELKRDYNKTWDNFLTDYAERVEKELSD